MQMVPTILNHLATPTLSPSFSSTRAHSMQPQSSSHPARATGWADDRADSVRAKCRQQTFESRSSAPIAKKGEDWKDRRWRTVRGDLSLRSGRRLRPGGVVHTGDIQPELRRAPRTFGLKQDPRSADAKDIEDHRESEGWTNAWE
jgi:hypothetical protein